MSPGPTDRVQRWRRSVLDHRGRVLVLALVVLLGVGALVVREGGDGPDGGASAGRPRGKADTTPVEDTPGTTGGIAGASSSPGGLGSGTTTGRSGSAAGTAPPDQPGGAVVGGSGPRPDGGPAPLAARPPVRCAMAGVPQAGPLPSADERDGLRWVTVARLAGSCDAASAPFRLQGIDTRLVWRSDADSFAVFVVDAVRGRDAAAGFADAQCAGSCSESQPVVPTAGDYSLEVQAGAAPWEVEIQEYRRP